MPYAKRAVLRAGFGIVIAVLVLSTVTAYRIQESFSQRTAEIHQRYVDQQETLTNLRRVLWMAGITTRDYFINPAPDRLDVYRSQLRQLSSDSARLFNRLSQLWVPDESSAQLQVMFRELWDVLFASEADGWSDDRKYSFVHGEIVPRRNAAGRLLRQLERANHGSLTESQDEFNRNRSTAAKRLVGLLGVGLAVGIAVSLFSLRHSEGLEQRASLQFAEVSKAKHDLEQLSARLMEIQEEERTRLSRELHDEIVQTLAVLRIEITQAQASPAMAVDLKENLSRARSLVDRTLRTVRDITLLLRPSLLDDLGLGPALQWQAEDFARRTGVPCQFSERGLHDGLPDAVKTCVYRVTQEALHNSEKHARATRVDVAVNRELEQLTVTIQDDGIGFRTSGRTDPRSALQFGLLGMRERAAGLGGTLIVHSIPGKGTRVNLSLPLTPVSAAPEPEREHLSV